MFIYIQLPVCIFEIVYEKIFGEIVKTSDLISTGIDTAMQHDVIMDPSKHDYMIVENEAARVAREAAKALKRSRSFCNNAITGLPTWTGQSGIKK